MKQGTVVFVYARDGWRIGRVVGSSEARCEVEHPDGERAVYPQKRIARQSARSVPTLGALAAYAQEVEALRRDCDLGTLWGMLDEREAPSTFNADELAGFCLPEAGSASEDAIAWALRGDDVWFERSGDGRYTPRLEDEVAARRAAFEAKERAAREFEAMVGWLSPGGRGGERPPEAAMALDALERLVLDEDTSDLAQLGRRLVREAFPEREHPEEWQAWLTLVALGYYGPDENLALRRAGLPRRFAPKTLEAAQTLAEMPPPPEPSVVDLRHLDAVAVDDPETTEVDDAFAVEHLGETWRVTVFIADVAAWVPSRGPVERAARDRVATVYLPEGKLPMLPEVLSDDVASLAAGRDRRALAFVLTYDNRARLVEFDIVEAWVRVRARLTYDDVEALLDGADGDYGTSVRQLFELADTLRDCRRAGGSITLDRREFVVHCHEQRLLTRPYRTDDRARRMVAEWMITVGKHTAQWCQERELPTIYRVQPAPPVAPHLPLDRALRGHELQRILRTMRRATLSLAPGGHAGLGVAAYTQVTSPLRRYADLLMHRQIKGWLQSGFGEYEDADLEAQFEAISDRAGAIARVERMSRRYWLLKALALRVGEPVTVELVREHPRGYIAELVDFGLTGVWHPKGPARLGDVLDVILKRADPRKNQLRLGKAVAK